MESLAHSFPSPIPEQQLCCLGPDSNALTHMLVWESLADRELKWSRFVVDPEWSVFHDRSRRPIALQLGNDVGLDLAQRLDLCSHGAQALSQKMNRLFL